MSAETVVVATGSANLASVLAGLRRIGVEGRLTESPMEVRESAALVLPGVGAFGAAMARLGELDLVEPLVERIDGGLPTLAICLGLQLLCETSEESPGVTGLGVLPSTITRFPNTVRVPQLGWNEVDPSPGCRMLSPGYAYFANSYRLTELPDGWHGATTDHGGRFFAAIERGPVLACQFHPELSGAWGIELLRRWHQNAVEASRC